MSINQFVYLLSAIKVQEEISLTVLFFLKIVQ